MILPHPTHNASRRAFLGGAPAALLAAGPVAAMSPSGGTAPADPLPAWFEEWKRQRARFNAHPTGEGPDADAIYKRMREMEVKMAETKATTIAGAVAQLSWVLEEAQDEFVYVDHEAALTLCRDALKGGVA